MTGGRVGDSNGVPRTPHLIRSLAHITHKNQISRSGNPSLRPIDGLGDELAGGIDVQMCVDGWLTSASVEGSCFFSALGEGLRLLNAVVAVPPSAPLPPDRRHSTGTRYTQRYKCRHPKHKFRHPKEYCEIPKRISSDTQKTLGSNNML